MKKVKLMLGVTALSAALLGTGYAAMTDTVNIGGKVSTANFCVQFIEKPQLYDGTTKVVDENNFMKTNEIGKLSANFNTANAKQDHKIVFNVENLKADVPITYKTKIGNLSSIDAQLESVLVTPNNVNYPAESVNLTVVIGEGENQIAYQGTLAALGTTLNIQDLILQEVNTGTTDEVPVTFTVEVQEDDAADYTGETAKSVGFDLEFNWKQLTGTVQ